MPDPIGGGGYLHTHTPVDQSSGYNAGAPTYPTPLYSSVAEWPTIASLGPLTITVAPAVSLITASSARINWTTNRSGSTRVLYGTTMAYGSTAGGTDGVAAHQVDLVGLTTVTLYYYRVVSNDGTYTVIAQGTFTTI